MIFRIEKYIEDNQIIENGDNIFVALSGGADSSCLLHSLYQLKDKYNLKVYAIHINHMIRSKEADDDQKFCEILCNSLNVPLTIKKIDVIKFSKEKKLSLEQAGRIIRYREFEQLDGKVALGHHKNDQVETVLMNILRGTSSEGLKGIEAINGKYIRPLLFLSRIEIEEYCKENHIDFVTDSTNLENDYFRNSIRNKVIPLLNDITNKDISDNILRLSKIISNENEYLSKLAEKYFKDIVKTKNNMILIDNKKIVDLHEVMAKRVIRIAIKNINGDLKDIEYKHTNDILTICKHNITGRAVDLPGNLRALVQFNKTYIYMEKETAGVEYLLNIDGYTEIKEKNIIIKAEIVDSFKDTSINDSIHYFNYDIISDKLYIRTKKEGDIINPAKGNGSKKLKKYYIDMKIDRFERNDLLLLAEGNNILCVFGKTYGKMYRPNGKCRILKLQFIERV